MFCPHMAGRDGYGLPYRLSPCGLHLLDLLDLLDLIASQRSYLHIPSHLGIRILTWILGGTSIQSITRAYTLSRLSAASFCFSHMPTKFSQTSSSLTLVEVDVATGYFGLTVLQLLIPEREQGAVPQLEFENTSAGRTPVGLALVTCPTLRPTTVYRWSHSKAGDWKWGRDS